MKIQNSCKKEHRTSGKHTERRTQISENIQGGLNNMKTEIINTPKKCSKCYGYGLWAIGDSCPMGPLDYKDGCPNKKCPECGSGGRQWQ